MSVLITGGSGLVGSAMKKLYPDYTYISSKDYDLTDVYETMNCFEKYKPESVVHLASVVLGGNTSDLQQFDSLIKNCQIHTNVFKCCEKYKVKKIISVLTVAMSSDDLITEESIIKGPLLSVNNHFGYIHSKRLLHCLSEGYVKAGLGKCVVLSPVNIYGSEDLNTSSRLIPTIFRRLKNGDIVFSMPKNMERQFVYNKDVANIIDNFLKVDINGLFIIGDEERVKISDLAERMATKLNVQTPVFSDTTSTNERCCVISKLPFDFKYTSINDGLEYMLSDTQEVFPSTQPKITLGDFQTTEEMKCLIHDVLHDNRLTYGKYCIEMEKEFAKMHKSKFAILSNSGTSSLQVGLAAMKEYYKWNDNDEILVPAITFVASVNTIISNNLKPVLVDAHPQYYNIDPKQIEKHITDKTRAIMVVHLFGQPCDMKSILEIANRYNLRIIEDSCETMNVRYGGTPVGTFGDFGAFSTYVAHILVTGVGGLLTTNNQELAVLARSLVNHGRNNIYISIDDDDNINREIIEKRFQFERVGYSYRITELEAALGVSQLKQLDEIIKQRQNNANYLIKNLSKFSDKIQLPTIMENAEHAFMMFPVVIKDENISKKDFVWFLESNNIETRDLMPITTQPVYKNWINEQDFPVASWLNKNGFYIGCHPTIDKNGLDHVINIFTLYLISH